MMGRVICLLATLGLVGCGGGEPVSSVKTVSVSGTVYLDDKPLDSAQIIFLSPNHQGGGRTDANGKFYLVSGAEPGDNKIYFSKIDAAGLDPASGMDQGQLEAAAQGAGLAVVPGQKIPPEYASAETTKLTYKVPPEGAKDVDFRLKSAP
jgi:hypothetical protein